MTAEFAPELIKVGTARGVTTLTLDSPPNRNALSRALMTELLGALEKAAADDGVRAVVLSHTGPVFCSGADLNETAAAWAGTAEMPAAMLGDLLGAVWDFPKPVVARVGGAARAGGLGLIAAADLAVVADDATFAFSEVRIGVVPAIISATVLRRLAPRAAAELLLTGEVFDGLRAAEIGLATRAVPVDELDEAVAEYTDALTCGGPIALAATKQLLRRPAGATVRAELDDLTALSVAYFGSDEGREGVTAFREKRSPAWIPQD
ncbi:enoyl-CoA hydratase [Pilimelia anulata]|uniref:Enoyl-CoA hydratase n=1 Tax=Pilimelia anulata TaxID=53371 RepID=A0A8J3F5P0_9ACTN|nr:enoyl-CoA hydratase-related protein [Pilimelia anulata]GGJ74290.1 enoyl-CoA hydratase [Pilimelia anulata]